MLKCPKCNKEFVGKSDVEFIKENNQCYECYNYEQQYIEENQYVRITRDMALDAGDPTLEGALWKW